MYGYNNNNWMTFNQLNELGGRIKKGSKAAFVVFKSNLYFDKKSNKNITKLVNYMLKDGADIELLDYKKVGYTKQYNVFNVEQIKNLPDEFYTIPKAEDLTEFEKNERAELLIQNSDAIIEYTQEREAYYDIERDSIFLPNRKYFKSDVDFYRVIFHELSHMSGSTDRLNRDLGGKYGSVSYAKEELIAELSTAYICAYLGFENTITDNVNYIDSWLSILKDDKQFILSAAAMAQKSADYILSFVLEPVVI
jgi:antirestriction protein ArdC